MSSITIIGNLGFIFSALSLLMQDILLLRLFAVAAGSLAVAYYLIVPGGPIWLSAGWNLFFLLINVVQIGLLFNDRLNARFSEEESELHMVLFPNLNQVQFMKLLRYGRWEDAQAGEVLARAGDNLIEITLIVHGEANALRDNRVIQVLHDGSLIGEVAYVTQRPFSADIILTQASRLLKWSKVDLDRVVMRNPLIGLAMARALILGLEPAPANRALTGTPGS